MTQGLIVNGSAPGAASQSDGRRGAVAATLWVLAGVAVCGALATRVVLSPPVWPPEALRASAVVRVLDPSRTTFGIWLPFVLWVASALLAVWRLAGARWRGWEAASTAWTARVTAYVAFGAVTAATCFAAATGTAELAGAPGFVASYAAAVAGSLLVGVFCLFSRVLTRPASPLARALDVTAFNAIVLFVVAELLVVAVGARSDSPLFHFDAFAGAGASEAAVRSNLRRFRFKPNTQFFDTLLNSRGYVDEEPFVATPRDFVAVLIADSFGTGPVVPYARNFATVAERKLQEALASRFERVAVHNMSVAWIGVPEYYYLMLTEALPTKPSVVAVCIFVGNDFDRFIVTPRQAAGRLLLGNWRAVQLANRLVRLRRERREGNEKLLGAQTSLPRGTPAFLDDPALEPPTFSHERFTQIERERLIVCNAADPNVERRYAGMYESLAQFRRVLGDKLLVVVIPDEFQVNDELWSELVSGLPRGGSLDRTLPQRRLGAFCAREGIAMLDLLEPLRQAQKRARVYHLRDTHWNSNGHRLAGEAIADRILRDRFGAGPARP
jgi:hypothetical protein